MFDMREFPAPPTNLPIAETIRSEDVIEKTLPEFAPRFVFPGFNKLALVSAAVIFVFGSSFYLLGNNLGLFKSEYQIATLSESVLQFSARFEKFFSTTASQVQAQFSNIENRFTQFKFTTEGKRGVVIVPSSNDDEAVKEQIKASFSDEVSIIPHDSESGIITPLFRERTGRDYLYLLVPINDEP